MIFLNGRYFILHSKEPIPVNKYLLKVNNRSSRKRCKWRQCRRSAVFNFEHFTYLLLILPSTSYNDKQILKNYLPISLLPISRKFCEQLLHNRMFKFVNENKLTSSSSRVSNQEICLSISIYPSITKYVTHSMKFIM